MPRALYPPISATYSCATGSPDRAVSKRYFGSVFGSCFAAVSRVSFSSRDWTALANLRSVFEG